MLRNANKPAYRGFRAIAQNLMVEKLYRCSGLTISIMCEDVQKGFGRLWIFGAAVVGFVNKCQ